MKKPNLDRFGPTLHLIGIERLDVLGNVGEDHRREHLARTACGQNAKRIIGDAVRLSTENQLAGRSQNRSLSPAYQGRALRKLAYFPVLGGATEVDG